MRTWENKIQTWEIVPPPSLYPLDVWHSKILLPPPPVNRGGVHSLNIQVYKRILIISQILQLILQTVEGINDTH